MGQPWSHQHCPTKWPREYNNGHDDGAAAVVVMMKRYTGDRPHADPDLLTKQI